MTWLSRLFGLGTERREAAGAAPTGAATPPAPPPAPATVPPRTGTEKGGEAACLPASQAAPAADTRGMPVPACAVDIVAEFEGFRSKPYLCSAGVATIGFGRTRYGSGAAVTLRDAPCTEDKARAWLAEDLATATAAVDAAVKVPLSENERAALISFAFNCGGAALRSSTLLKKLNAGDRAGAATEFGKWVKAGGKTIAGLERRRAAEAALFRKP